MSIAMPQQSAFGSLALKMREGVVIEKGIAMTAERIKNNRKLYEHWCNFFTAYPDLFLDMIKPEGSAFTLFFYQRIFLRVCLRFPNHYCVAPRAFSKTFLSVIAMFLKCMFQPRTKVFLTAPVKEQSAKICKEKMIEIFDLFPILKKEILSPNDPPGNYGNDYVKLTFRNMSIFDVVGALDSTRGGRRNGGIVDEVRDHDGDTLNEIVLPLMAVPRFTAAKRINPNEPQPQKIFITSAGTKGSYAYNKLIECFEDSIIQPKTTFVWSLDYRVPLMHGLLNEQFINEIKLSPTYNEDSFAREFLGYWTGSSEDSWFDYNRLNKYRKIINPESTRKIREGQEAFYLLSVDVGRISDQTVVTVIKVTVRESVYYAHIVNVIVLGRTKEEKHFARQAIDLKKLIEKFRPKELIIDGNGLGIGLVDYMIKDTIGDDGIVYPPYGVINNDDYKRIQPKDCDNIIYIIKANSELNSLMHGNCFTRVSSGKVFFLISEQEAKSKLLATKVGAKMSFIDRKQRLMPHEMTTRLFEEMVNLRLKSTGNSFTIALEKINTKLPKDKFSSLEMGLWRLKELEDENLKRYRKKSSRNRQLVFYTQRG